MADQGKWYKLWCSALDDQDLENLSLENWARWVRLGAYIKKHGKGGRLIFKSPATALQNIFRVTSFDGLINIIKVLPNYALNIQLEGGKETHLEGKIPSSHLPSLVTNANVTYKIKCHNWYKYQGDMSVDRMRKHRAKNSSHVTPNVTAQEETRSRGEERIKDKDVKPLTLTAVTKPKKDKSRATPNSTSTVVYGDPRSSSNVNNAVNKNGQTAESEETHGSRHSPSPGVSQSHTNRKTETNDLRKVPPAGQILNSVRNKARFKRGIPTADGS